MAKLENWYFGITQDEALWKAPELHDPRLMGNVYGHSNPQRHYDGKAIVTSKLVGYDESTDEVITSSGSRYILGEVEPGYLAQYPDAKEKLIKTLKSL